MLPEMIVDALYSTIAQSIEPHFADYIRQHRTPRWLLFSDYVLKHPGRPNDVFAFTLMPGGSHFEPVTAALTSGAIHDFKDVRKVSEPMVKLLTDTRLFTFCFIVKPSRVITRNTATLRQMLDQSIAMMERWEDAKSHAEIIKKFKAMRKSADAKSFSVRLVDNIILATALASFLTYLVCKHVRAERVGWFSDRDSITTSHQGIAGHFYGVNASACCQRLMNGWRGPELGLNGPVEEGGSLWCDAYLRVPDYFAGAISAWNIEENRLVSESTKYNQVLVEAIADKPNVHIIRLNMDWREDELAVSASRVEVSRKP